MNYSTPYYADEHVILHHGDALNVVSTLPDESINCIVTSPPYFNLRDYGNDGQLGAEATVHDFVDKLVAIFREARRTLSDDGTFWLNLGDSYGDSKQLRGVPWRVALALQDDGWILRNDIIWHKPNAMPESPKDRLSGRHEHLFMFTKSPRYWFDLDPIREPASEASIARSKYGNAKQRSGSGPALPGEQRDKYQAWDPTNLLTKGCNPGDVWTIATTPFKGAHFATSPLEIPRRAIASGCKPGGTVLDMFNGSGTTGAATQTLGRKYVGVDINADYLDLTLNTRLQNGVLDIFGGAA